MQGNCADSLNSNPLDVAGVAPLDTLEPWQCALLTNMSLGSLDGHAWLHNLYIRHHRTTRDSKERLLWCNEPECNLLLTNMTLQGDGKDNPTSGVTAIAGQTYADGMTSATALPAVCYVSACHYRIVVLKVLGMFGVIHRVKVPCLHSGPLW